MRGQGAGFALLSSYAKRKVLALRNDLYGTIFVLVYFEQLRSHPAFIPDRRRFFRHRSGVFCCQRAGASLLRSTSFITKELQMFKKLVLVGVLAFSALLTGCASVPMASAEKDAQTKTFAVNPEKANIYVYRNESFGGGVKIDVELDDKPVGQTAAKTYFAFEVAPGVHKIVSKAENDETLNVPTEAGKNYFVWQEVKMGFLFARNKLALVDDQTGRSGVGECQLIEAVK